MEEYYEAAVSSSYGRVVHLFRRDPATGWSVSKCGAWRFLGARAGPPPEEAEGRAGFPLPRCRRCFR
jgi:hypothetical protein